MSPPRDSVIIGCAVVNGIGGAPLEPAAVRVSDGRILAVGEQSAVLADARRDGVDDVIDLGGW